MTLVLLPGMNCSPSLWAGVTASPELGGVEIDAPQLDGATLDEAVDLVLGRLPPRCSLAGLSLGGIVAMAVARRAPERIERLALLDTSARPPTSAQREGWMATLGRLTDGVTARAVQESLLELLLAPGATGESVAATLRMADEVGEVRLADQLRAQLTRVDERSALDRLRVPTLVLTGESDALCPRERHDEIVSLVPGSWLRVLRGAGHLSPLEQPNAVAHELAVWLDAPTAG